jgi:hypothetical protein
VARAEALPVPRTRGSDAVSGTAGTATQELRLTGTETAQVRGGEQLEIDVDTSSSVVGVGVTAPLQERTGGDEQPAPLTGAEMTDDARGYPYQRYELVPSGALPEAAEVVWTGTALARHELQLSVWDGEAWVLVDAGRSDDGGDITLVASVGTDDLHDGALHLLVQNGPRTQPTLQTEVDGAFQTPGTYDVAVGHLTDTQYLVEQNPASFTALNAWFAANAEARDVGFVMHTGDLIQNWLRGDQEPDRAHVEFEHASRVQEILEEAGVPHGVLAGNHDNVWGASNDLFDSYFPASRYEGFDWFGGEGPLGMGAHYSTVSGDHSEWLFLSLRYDAQEAEIAWAQEVLERHPRHNVVLGTHEYLRPEIDERANPGNGRWTSQGDVFFERLVEPYDNVVLTLSGHLHGVRQRALTDVGGTPGRTVVETVADYQSYEVDSARDALFLRMLQVDVAGEQLGINAYSPDLDSFTPHEYETRDGWYTPESDELVMPISLQYDKRVASSGLLLLGGVEDVVDRSSADGAASLLALQDGTVVWGGLQAGTGYGWYVQDEGGPAASVLTSTPDVFVAALADDGEEPGGPGGPGEGEEPGGPGEGPGGTNPGETGPGGTGPGETDPADGAGVGGSDGIDGDGTGGPGAADQPGGSLVRTGAGVLGALLLAGLLVLGGAALRSRARAGQR